MKRLIGITLVGVLAISVLGFHSIAFAQIALKDVAGHLFEFEISKLVEAGIIRGFPDRTFKPDASIIRADTAIILAGARKLALEAPAVSPFKDVPTTHYAYRHIVAVQKAGFMKGYPDGTFRPGANITRSELAALMGQVKGLAAEDAKITMPLALAQDEAAIPKWAVGWVTLGIKPVHQYLTHRSEAGFRLIAPLASATRGEVAYGVYQVLNPPRVGGTVNVGTWQEPDTLHDYTANMASAWSILQLVKFPGVGRDQTWATYPGYLKEIPTVENGLWKVIGDTMEITYRIRPGLKFHDGKPATLDDWAYNFMVFMDPLTPVVSRLIELKINLDKGAGAHGIKGFDFVGVDGVKVYYKELDWRANLWLPGVGIYPRHIVEKPFADMKRTGVPEAFRADEIMARKPISLGPYRVIEWKHGSHISMERNPDFLLGAPLIERVVYRFVPDTTALLARVIAGKDVDVTSIGLSFDQGMQLAERPPAHLKVHFVESLIWEHIGINLENPDNPLIDLRVRKAFIQGIDREGMVRKLFLGRQPVAHSFLAPKHWAYDEAAPVKYTYNPEVARKLLDEAGWKLGPDGWRYKAGKRLTLELRTTAGSALREGVQAVLKAQLKDVGIDLDIGRNIPAGALFHRDHFYGRKWPNMIMFAWVMSPVSIGDVIFRADMIPSPETGWAGQNAYAWKNDEATELLKKAGVEMSEVERRRLLGRVQRILTEELPVIPLYFRSEAITSKVNLASVRPVQIAGQYVTWNGYNWYFR